MSSKLDSYLSHKYQDIPTSKTIDYALVYERDGYCCILNPSPKYQQPGEWDLDAIGRLHANYLPNVVEFFAVKKELLPKDPVFRDAWEKGNVERPIRINLDKCILIHRDRLKQAAMVKIEQLNIELEEAEAKGNTPLCVSIKRTKPILRKMHEMNLSHIKTVEELKFAVPNELKDVWTFYSL